MHAAWPAAGRENDTWLFVDSTIPSICVRVQGQSDSSGRHRRLELSELCGDVPACFQHLDLHCQPWHHPPWSWHRRSGWWVFHHFMGSHLFYVADVSSLSSRWKVIFCVLWNTKADEEVGLEGWDVTVFWRLLWPQTFLGSGWICVVTKGKRTLLLCFGLACKHDNGVVPECLRWTFIKASPLFQTHCGCWVAAMAPVPCAQQKCMIPTPKRGPPVPRWTCSELTCRRWAWKGTCTPSVASPARSSWTRWRFWRKTARSGAAISLLARMGRRESVLLTLQVSWVSFCWG